MKATEIISRIFKACMWVMLLMLATESFAQQSPVTITGTVTDESASISFVSVFAPHASLTA